MEPERAKQRARGSQSEPEGARESQSEIHTTLFCRETLKYGTFYRETLKYCTFCRETSKYGTFCRETLKYALWAEKWHKLRYELTPHFNQLWYHVCMKVLGGWIMYHPTSETGVVWWRGGWKSAIGYWSNQHQGHVRFNFNQTSRHEPLCSMKYTSNCCVEWNISPQNIMDYTLPFVSMKRQM